MEPWKRSSPSDRIRTVGLIHGYINLALGMDDVPANLVVCSLLTIRVVPCQLYPRLPLPETEKVRLADTILPPSCPIVSALRATLCSVDMSYLAHPFGGHWQRSGLQRLVL